MNKSKIPYVLLLCTILILGLSVSAQETDKPKLISYHGESENWAGTFTIEFTEAGITKLGNIKYKGEDVDSIGYVSCTYETIAGTSSITSQLAGLSKMGSPIGEKGTLSSRGAGGNINLYSKIEVVKVTVEWSGKTESFNLYK